MYNQEDMFAAENRIENYVNSLNSMRDGSSNPAKVDNKIKQIKNELRFLREEFPQSEYCDLRNIMFGLDVIEHFNLDFN